MSVSDTTRIGH